MSFFYGCNKYKVNNGSNYTFLNMATGGEIRKMRHYLNIKKLKTKKLKKII